MVKNLPANAGDAGSIPGLGRSPREGNGYPLKYSCLGHPTDRGDCEPIGSQRVRHNLATEYTEHKIGHEYTWSSRKAVIGT